MEDVIKNLTPHDLDRFSTRVVQQLDEMSEIHKTLKETGAMSRELSSMLRRAEANLRVIGDEIKQMSVSATRKRA
jgi:hypothetical protein